MKKYSNIIWGVLLIALGIVWGLNALDIVKITIFFDGWWTLFIIVPCAVEFFKEPSKTGNLVGIAIGVILLLFCQDILSWAMLKKLLIPVVLVFIGVSLLLRNVFTAKITKRINDLNHEMANKNEHCATFGGGTVNYDGQEFRGTELTAVFGAMECDLRRAIIADDAVVNATAIFGGIDILVPEDVEVKVKSSSLFGGVDVKRRKKQEQELIDGATIYVNAFCLFGGVDIK